jgi:hypothetical protein
VLEFLKIERRSDFKGNCMHVMLEICRYTTCKECPSLVYCRNCGILNEVKKTISRWMLEITNKGSNLIVVTLADAEHACAVEA